MKPDRFDIISLTAAASLLACAVFIAAAGGGSAPPPRASVAREAAAGSADPALMKRLEAAREQMDAGLIKESVDGLRSISAQAPSLAEAHALLGQAYARRSDYPQAVREYRLAVYIDPNYTDKKSPKFIGKRIKAALKECAPILGAALAKDPADAQAASALRDVHYLEGMLAGGCE